jgi:large subunit ribosomal protein L18
MKKIKNALKKKTLKQQKRSNRVRTKLVATTSRLRLAVYRSNNYIYAQIIDDLK